MNELRKGFYVFDMALFGFFLFALNHTMFIKSWTVEIALDIALLLRITVSLLLYKQERLAIVPLSAFVLLYYVAIYTDTFQNFTISMEKFPRGIMGTEIVESPLIFERPIVGAMLMRSIKYWVWMIPIAVYVVQYATKLTKNNGYPWYYMIGGIIFKDSLGKLLLSMALPLFATFLIGYEMQENLSFFALMSIPLVGYYFWNRHIGRDPYWIEYIVLLIGLYVFDKAQYKVDGERVAYLTASATIVFAVCCWMFYKSRSIVLSLLAFFMMAFLLPTISLGYNIYQSMEGARSINYGNVGLSISKGYMYIKKDIVINGKAERRMGVRNRYRTTIPCEYKFVFPSKMFSPFATCIKEDKDSVIRSVEYGYVLE